MRIKVTARRFIIPKVPNSENDDDEDTQSLNSITSDTTITNGINDDDDDETPQNKSPTINNDNVINCVVNHATTGNKDDDASHDTQKLSSTKMPSSTSTPPSTIETPIDDNEENDYDSLLKIDSKSGQFICTKCNRKFKNKISAKKHAMKPSLCATCNRQFCNAFVLSKHIWKQHTKCITNDDNDVNVEIQKCSTCDKSFTSYNKLKEHESQHIIENNESDFTYCEICEKSVKGKYMYERHIERHQREIFKCTICYKGFDTERKLDFHIARDCDNLSYHQCKLCDRKITSVMHFGYHLNKHSGEKPFFCETCSESYLKPCSLHPIMKNKKRRHNDDTIKEDEILK